MIQRVVKKRTLKEEGEANHDLEYWLNVSPAMRVEAVDLLRKQHYGSTARLQRTARVIQRPRG